jgi:molecular chaperone GrpE
MNLEPNLKDDPANEASLSSFDDFLKELEEAEKSLSISGDMEIEVEDSFDDTQSSNFDMQAVSEDFALETFAPPAEPRPASAANGGDVASRQELQKLHIKVSTLEEEREELKKMVQRRQNDFDNFRKRTERERSETFENILAKLSAQMLPVVDNLSRALESAEQVSIAKSKEFQHFIEGILLVNQQVTDVLIEMGIQPINAVGQPFDPHYHEAVATAIDSEKEPGTVVEEILTGYKIGKKVIRPVMVKVSVAPNNSAPGAAPADVAQPAEEETISESADVSLQTEVAEVANDQG